MESPVSASSVELGGESVELPRWPVLRIFAWALILAAIGAFVIADGVRTNWIIGDLDPEGGEVALPRLATIALLVGIALLSWHQVRARRRLPDTRYRGPSVLVLLTLVAGVATLVALPVRQSIHDGLEGAMLDLLPALIWTLSAPVAMVLVVWLVLGSNVLPGVRPFADARPTRHALIGLGVGAGTQTIILFAVTVFASVRRPLFEAAPAGPLPGLLLPGVPLWLGLLGAVLLAPISEELLFRGLVLHAWLREYGRWVALIGSSALFGLIHFGLSPLEGLVPELPRLAMLTIGGLVLGILALRTGSLIAPVVAHATMNTITFVLALALIGAL